MRCTRQGDHNNEGILAKVTRWTLRRRDKIVRVKVTSNWSLRAEFAIRGFLQNAETRATWCLHVFLHGDRTIGLHSNGFSKLHGNETTSVEETSAKEVEFWKSRRQVSDEHWPTTFHVLVSIDTATEHSSLSQQQGDGTRSLQRRESLPWILPTARYRQAKKLTQFLI